MESCSVSERTRDVQKQLCEGIQKRAGGMEEQIRGNEGRTAQIDKGSWSHYLISIMYTVNGINLICLFVCSSVVMSTLLD